MRNPLPPRILSIMLPFTFARYMPMRVRQASPTSTPAALILEQNPGCCLLSSALSVCTSLTPGFTALAPSQQAPCLCYSSTVWAPGIFDDAVKTCADYASTVLPAVYPPLANLENFCMNVGNVYFGPASAAATTTAGPYNAACNIVNSLVNVCTSQTPGFATLSATNQASCLCYVSSSTWAPTIFDNAVSTCKEFAKTAETPIYPIVQSLDGFCTSVGNMMSTGAVTTTTMAPIIAQPLRPSVTSSSVTSKTSSESTTSINITITIGGVATNTATVSKNDARPKRVTEGEVIGVSFACALLLLFLC